MAKPSKPKVDMGADKESVKSRTDRSKVVGTAGPNSPIFTANATVQQAQSDLVAAGNELAAADADVKAEETKLAGLRNTRDDKIAAFDIQYGVYVALGEKHAVTAKDLEGMGLPTLSKTTYTLAVPVAVEVKYDAAKGLVRIYVKQAPGMTSTLIEVGNSATGPWTRLDGVGARQALSGYAPGTYWVRAASARASERSDWTSPVAVIVK